MRYFGSDSDDETAVRLVLAGEREMFVPLLKRHYESVLLCRRILGSDADAQDAAQEAALQAFFGLGRLREPRGFGAWLHSIAANLARSALHRRRLLSLESLEEGVGLARP
jgi:DNA-directed RNA polymerase specialized sigma24 family protein